MVSKFFRTKWLSNKWTKGSYSHISSRCDLTKSSPSDLGRPILVKGTPRVLIAGEAVHTSHYSTTHGAFESGLQQSNILYEYIKSKSDDKRHK